MRKLILLASAASFSLITAAVAVADVTPSLDTCIQSICDPNQILSCQATLQTVSSCLNNNVCASAPNLSAAMQCSEDLNNRMSDYQLWIALALANPPGSAFSSTPGFFSAPNVTPPSSPAVPYLQPPTRSVPSAPLDSTNPGNGAGNPNTNSGKGSFNWLS